MDCYKKSWMVGAGFELETCYDNQAGNLIFKAVIPNNSWFSIGFGPTMTDTDMIAWFAEKGVGSVKDYWSGSHSAPEEDSVNNLIDMTTPFYDSATDKITFITKRALDTGNSNQVFGGRALETANSSQDFLVRTGEQLPMCFGYVLGSAQWRKHDEYGVWSL